MSRVYGDSTPFPHDVDYLALLEQGIDCAIKLVSAAQSMSSAQQSFERLQGLEASELRELGSLLERVEAAATSQPGSARGRETAGRLIETARQIVNDSATRLSSEMGQERARAEAAVQGARQAGYRAVEEFIGNHTPPGSSLGSRLSVSPERCTAQVSIGTPFNVKAVFAIDIPDAHPWARPRRVSELVASLEIRLPQESGWLSKRVEMMPVKLERYYVGDAQNSLEGGQVQLRKAPASGAGFELRVNPKAEEPVVVCPIGDDGTVDSQQSLALHGRDAQAVMALWTKIGESSADLYSLRGAMKSARFGNQPLENVDNPSILADALIRDMAPLTVEISRRSGAPGELVLRRDLGDRRREEMYLTHSELLRKIFVLAPESRSVFAPLGLSSPELGRLSTAPVVADSMRASASGAPSSLPSRPPGLPRNSSAVPPAPRRSQRPSSSAASVSGAPPASSRPASSRSSHTSKLVSEAPREEASRNSASPTRTEDGEESTETRPSVPPPATSAA